MKLASRMLPTCIYDEVGSDMVILLDFGLAGAGASCDSRNLMILEF